MMGTSADPCGSSPSSNQPPRYGRSRRSCSSRAAARSARSRRCRSSATGMPATAIIEHTIRVTAESRRAKVPSRPSDARRQVRRSSRRRRRAGHRGRDRWKQAVRQGSEARRLQGVRQRPAAANHDLPVGEHRRSRWSRRSTSARACARRCRSVKESAKRFLTALRDGDLRHAARFQRRRLHAGPTDEGQGSAFAGDRPDARVGRHVALRRRSSTG